VELGGARWSHQAANPEENGLNTAEGKHDLVPTEPINL
jgi:hypothetical protein